MPQKSYYHFWYESYSEKKSEITFWEFIELMILRIPEDDQLNTRNLFGIESTISVVIFTNSSLKLDRYRIFTLP